MTNKGANPFDKLLENLEQNGDTYKFYDLKKLNDPRYGKWQQIFKTSHDLNILLLWIT